MEKTTINMLNLYRIFDRIDQWWRYPQPTRLAKSMGFYTNVIDTDYTAQRLASEQSAEYIIKHLRTTPNFATDYDLRQWLVTTQLNENLVANGQIMEFGVGSGRSINHFARCRPIQTIHGFDNFEGLPETWTNRFPKGSFARKYPPRVRKNCRLHRGWFDQTIPEFVRVFTEPVAFLHIDCDLYSSTKIILNQLTRQLVPGSVILFDEYINYPGWQLDEFRAWQEHVTKHCVNYEYIGYVSRHQQVAVRIL